MCLMVYIGSDRPLPTTEPWSAERPGFHVVAAGQAEAAVREHLRTRYVAYAGSHAGCGCGFGYESEREFCETMGEIPDPGVVSTCLEDRRQRKESVAAPRAYLEVSVRDGPVRVLATWGGEEDTPPRVAPAVTPAFFGGDAFGVEEFALLEVEGPA